jgi:NAD(P)-dependent dehydrogenase (short-subunit alcohol dehydrogenase family)
MATAVLPRLSERQGSILNIASMSSYFSLPAVPGYGASKAGIVQLTKTLAEAWAPRNVRVNAIAPGWIETKLTAPVQANAEMNERLIKHTPLRRWGVPQDVTGAALFLASSAASFITGITIPVDGGYSAVM